MRPDARDPIRSAHTLDWPAAMNTLDPETPFHRHAGYLATLGAVVGKVLASTGARAWLFGSRAIGTAYLGSDVDITIDAPALWTRW
jgi:hypothetical protein